MPERPGSGIFYGWWIVAATATILFLGAGLGFYAFGVFLTPLEEEFGWSRGQISLAMSMATLVSGISSPLLGHLTDRLGARTVLAAGGAVMAVCYAFLGFTWSLLYLYAVYIVMAVGRAGIQIVPVSAVISKWFVRRRGLALGITTAGIGMGGLIMAPVSALLIETFGWRAAYAILGGVIFLVVVPLALFVIRQRPSDMGLLPDGDAAADPDGPADGAARPAAVMAARRGVSYTPGQATRTSTFWLLSIAMALVFLAQGSVLLHIIPFLEDREVSAGVAGAALGAIAGIGIIGKILAGWLTDRLSPRLVTAGAFVAQAVGLVILLRFTSAPGVVAFVLVYGLSMGSVVVLQSVLVGYCFGLEFFAPIMGTVHFLTTLGSFSGPVFAGFMHDATGSYTIAFTIFIVLDLLAATFMFLLRVPGTEPARRGEPAAAPR